jgi:hypothetical protein
VFPVSKVPQGESIMATPSKSVNAWIYLREDEPAGTSYSTPGSSYQPLITHG